MCFFIVGGCVIAALIGAYFLCLGYQHLRWNDQERIFVENLKKYEREKQGKREDGQHGS